MILGGDHADVTLVDITPVPIVGQIRSMYEVERPDAEVRPPQLRDLHERLYMPLEPSQLNIIHIDSITAKVHLVPHFDDHGLMCALRMWQAR